MLNHTFVIPAHKESPFLEDCIVNLLKQSIKSEIIITTSTPTDYIRNLAEKYRLNYIVNSIENCNIATNWNFAILKAKTKYVTIAHQDDIYEANYISAILEGLNRHKNVVIAFTNHSDLIDGETVRTSLNKIVKQILLFPFLIKSSIKSHFIKKMTLSFGNPICCPTVTFNKEIIGGFKFSEDYLMVLDWYAWLQLSYFKGSFLYINQDLLKHRIHQESETTEHINNGKRQFEEHKILGNIWGKNFSKFLMKAYIRGHKGNKL